MTWVENLATAMGSEAFMRTFFIALAVLFSSRLASADAINPIVGDASWVAAYGRAPTAADDLREVERVSTHLAWVEHELRRADISHLAPELAARRMALLDVLAEYRRRARFPRNERYSGRRPRFIDDEGNVCAVGRLIEVSAGRELAEAIDARFEYEHLLDIRDDRLSAWIAESGFTAIELAMIQPGYGGARPHLGPPVEPPPLEWTAAQLTALLARVTGQLGECAEGERTRSIRVTVRLDRRRGPRVSVVAAPRAVATCAEELVRAAIGRARFSPPSRAIRVTRTHRLRLPPEARARAEIARALDAASPALHRCMPPARAGRRVALRVRVDEAGRLSVMEARIPVDPRSRGPRSIGADPWPPHARACFTGVVGRLRIRAPPRPLETVYRFAWGGSASIMDLASRIGRPAR